MSRLIFTDIAVSDTLELDSSYCQEKLHELLFYTHRIHEMHYNLQSVLIFSLVPATSIIAIVLTSAVLS